MADYKKQLKVLNFRKELEEIADKANGLFMDVQTTLFDIATGELESDLPVEILKDVFYNKDNYFHEEFIEDVGNITVVNYNISENYNETIYPVELTVVDTYKNTNREFLVRKIIEVSGTCVNDVLNKVKAEFNYAYDIKVHKYNEYGEIIINIDPIN